MSWLDDQERRAIYECAVCNDKFVKSTPVADWDKIREVNCDVCGTHAEYKGFEPTTTGQTRVSYEQNGRQAYRISDGNGNVRCVAKSKLVYQETGRIEGAYTREFQEHLVKNNRTDILNKQLTPGKGAAEKAKESELDKA